MSFKDRTKNNKKIDTIAKVAGTEMVIETKSPQPEHVVEIAKEVAKKKTAEADDIPKIARVAVDLVNIRKEPSQTSEIVKQVTKGAEFNVSEKDCKNGFVGIIIDGQVVFIMESLVEVFLNPIYKGHDVSTLGAKAHE